MEASPVPTCHSIPERPRLEGTSGDHQVQPPAAQDHLEHTAQDGTRRASNISRYPLHRESTSDPRGKGRSAQPSSASISLLLRGEPPPAAHLGREGGGAEPSTEKHGRQPPKKIPPKKKKTSHCSIQHAAESCAAGQRKVAQTGQGSACGDMWTPDAGQTLPRHTRSFNTTTKDPNSSTQQPPVCPVFKHTPQLPRFGLPQRQG